MRAIDWTGKKKYKLTFVKPTSLKLGGRIKWEALCDCGNTVITLPGENIKSCGCLKYSNKGTHPSWGKKVKIGDRFAKLVAISPAKCIPKSSVERWNFQCDCGNQTVASVWKVLHNSTKSCGCLIGKHRIYSPIHSSARRMWRQNYTDGLSFEDFLKVTQLPCNYCNILPSNSFTAAYNGKLQGTFIYNGLDRIDSNGDHSLKNIVPCCWTCNRMKSDMDLSSFAQHIKKIYTNISMKISSTFPT